MSSTNETNLEEKIKTPYEIKQLTTEHTEEFSNLILNMYANLKNLEWFSPMPYDNENVKAMIENPRFYIVGYFENGVLCAVSSLDYKCGKLIGTIDLPKDCNTEKLVEIAFTMVHSSCQGRGIMKILVAHLLEKLKADGFEWAFGKVHKDNLASSKSLLNRGFEFYSDFSKPVKVCDFKGLAEKPFILEETKIKAKETLSKIDTKTQETFNVDYKIIVKKL